MISIHELFYKCDTCRQSWVPWRMHYSGFASRCRWWTRWKRSWRWNPDRTWELLSSRTSSDHVNLEHSKAYPVLAGGCTPNLSFPGCTPFLSWTGVPPAPLPWAGPRTGPVTGLGGKLSLQKGYETRGQGRDLGPDAMGYPPEMTWDQRPGKEPGTRDCERPPPHPLLLNRHTYVKI